MISDYLKISMRCAIPSTGARSRLRRGARRSSGQATDRIRRIGCIAVVGREVHGDRQCGPCGTWCAANSRTSSPKTSRVLNTTGRGASIGLRRHIRIFLRLKAYRLAPGRGTVRRYQDALQGQVTGNRRSPAIHGPTAFGTIA